MRLDLHTLAKWAAIIIVGHYVLNYINFDRHVAVSWSALLPRDEEEISLPGQGAVLERLLAFAGGLQDIVADIVEHPLHLAAGFLEPRHERQRERAVHAVPVNCCLSLLRGIDHQRSRLGFCRCGEAAVEAAAQRPPSDASAP
jgi:hypothetical protein